MSPSMVAAAGAEGAELWPTESTGVPTGKLGMWLFLASEIMFFTGLVGSYIVLRLGAPSWPDTRAILDIPLLALNTFILLSSSFTMAQALSSIQEGDVRGLRRSLGWTFLLGAVFLGIKASDWVHLIHEGVGVSSGLFGSCYFLLTGFHGLHVLAGLILLGLAWLGAGRGRFNGGRWGRVECVGLYWHFVDAVWIVLFTVLVLL